MAPSYPTAETMNGKNWRNNFVRNLCSPLPWTKRILTLLSPESSHVLSPTRHYLTDRTRKSQSRPTERNHKFPIHGRTKTPPFHRRKSQREPRRTRTDTRTPKSQRQPITPPSPSVSPLNYV